MTVALRLGLALALLFTAAIATARVEDVFTQGLPEVVIRVEPRYPDEARARRVEGTVVVHAFIDTLGRVTETRVVRSVPELDAAAVEAVMQWTFKPAGENERPIGVWVAIPVRFELEKGPRAATPVCEDADEPKNGPLRLCGLRQDDSATFVIGAPRESMVDTTLFDLARYPDECDVELDLLPAGFARGPWPCDRSTGRLALRVSPTEHPWLLAPAGVRIAQVRGIGLRGEPVVRPIALWTKLFGTGPANRFTDLFDSLARAIPPGLEMPEVVHRVSPALLNGADPRDLGTVELRGLVNAEGRIEVAIVHRSVPVADTAALAAFRKFRFKPAKLGGKPYPVWVLQAFTFVGEREGAPR